MLHTEDCIINKFSLERAVRIFKYLLLLIKIFVSYLFLYRNGSISSYSTIRACSSRKVQYSGRSKKSIKITDKRPNECVLLKRCVLV